MEIIVKVNFKSMAESNYWVLFKWCLMAASIFWMVVFRLSEQGVKLPEFVYVNF